MDQRNPLSFRTKQRNFLNCTMYLTVNDSTKLLNKTEVISVKENNIKVGTHPTMDVLTANTGSHNKTCRAMWVINCLRFVLTRTFCTHPHPVSFQGEQDYIIMISRTVVKISLVILSFTQQSQMQSSYAVWAQHTPCWSLD